ncbi:MAG: hypothetical protein K5649_04835 [Lachnospiraceae bacterium]|nr:hypothetical protein [Lachnospiraceae bacterium]
MIEIGKPYVTKENGFAYLRAHIRISDDTVEAYRKVAGKLKSSMWVTDIDYPPAYWSMEDSNLYFKVSDRYEAYLCSQRSNAFVAALLWYALVTGSDIRFIEPLSEKLKQGITENLLPALAEKGFSSINLLGPVTNAPVENAGGIVTGMSCGVDSFYTLHHNPVNYLSFYSGNCILPHTDHIPDVDVFFNERERTYAEYLSNAKIIAEHHDIPLVAVSTNMDRDYYRGGYTYSAMYRHSACTLSLEHLFATYISSSSGHREHNTDVNLLGPTQNYEDLLCESLQTETFKYMTSDHELRVNKIRAIADDKDFQQYAEVCFNQGVGRKNCGECFGCWKTMIPLDLIGKLDQFGNSFNLEKYYANREKTFADLIRFSKLPEAFSARDTVAQIKKLAEEEPSEAGKLFLNLWGLSCSEGT